MEPEFGLCFRGRLWDELSAAGVPVHDLGAVRFSRPWSVLRARRRLKRVLRGAPFGAAVTHANWPHAVFAPVVRGSRVGLVNAVHDALARPIWLDRWAARTAPDLVLANSQFTAVPAATFFARSPVEVVYLPVAPPESFDRAATRHAVRTELGAPADAVVLLQASRLERWKGQRVHVEALGRLKGVPGWEVWFAGGPQKAGEAEFFAELRAAVAQLGISDRVRFLGQRSDVPRLMAAADVYCQPNAGPEPFGVVFVEALYAGLPVVTSDLGGGREVVDSSCGVLVPPGEPAAVAAALAELISDPARRAALGAGGPKRAEELCAPHRQLDRIAGLLQKVSS
ncbi:glycosyltransferase [Gemmata obscuriglobus]|nr:glycosyltransferase [Gemmata obscuriglobus]